MYKNIETMKIKPFVEVLVLAVGTTPQIITETIYALIHGSPPIRPDKIHVVTTATGRTIVTDRLLKNGIFDEFVREFRLEGLAIGDDDCIVPHDGKGCEIDDIIGSHESEAMGNLITSLIRTLSQDEHVRLHCSIAGGRKTMSFYMGAALQLFGRPWDRLYHVLVSPEFESNPLFFYKPKRNRVIESRLPDGTMTKLETKNAQIHLAELPFIRLRDKLSLQGKSFHDLVKEGQEKIDTATFQPELFVNIASRTVQIGPYTIQMNPAHLIVYSELLRNKTTGCVHPERPYCLECTDCFQPLSSLLSEQALERMIHDYRNIYRNAPYRADELHAQWKKRTGTESIRQALSKITRSITEGVTDERIRPYYVVSAERIYAGSRYGVRIEKGKITIQ